MSPTTAPDNSDNPESDNPESDSAPSAEPSSSAAASAHPEPDIEAGVQNRRELLDTLANMTTVDLSKLSHEELLEFARFVDICDEAVYERVVVDDLAGDMQASDRGAANNAISGHEGTPLGRAMGEHLHERAMPELTRVEVLAKFFEQRGQ